MTLPTHTQSSPNTEDGKPAIPEAIRWSDWRTLNLAYFDLETTSLEPTPLEEADSFESWLDENLDKRILEFGCQIRCGEELVDSLYLHINPGFPISPEVSKIHGITDDVVAHCGGFADYCDQILKFLAQADCVVAYNGLKFDKPFLEFEVSRVKGRLIRMSKPMIDPYVLYVEYNKKIGLNKKATLFKAASNFGCGQASSAAYGQADLHRTEPDVNMTAAVLMKMGERLPDCLDMLIEDQWIAHTRQNEYRKSKNIGKRPKKESL